MHARVCRQTVPRRLVNSGDILAAELTATDEGDASQVVPLLDRIDGPVSTVR
jgi:hypothetical protein